MKTYLVGGAVRDALLGRPCGDRDFVVVGATPEQMTARGFRPVGRDFPVFLHPQTHEEHALARCERKAGRGYRGFTVLSTPDITLEQDLARRDFTINAIAQDDDGTLVDPFNGLADLRARRLRHVSEAFVEDPVRILRAARFMARWSTLGFTIAPETMALMRRMVAEGEVDHLVSERVFQELSRALTEPTPSAFLRTLRGCGALARVLGEVDALYGVPQRAEFHPEIDTGIHVELSLDIAAHLAPGDALVGFCVLTHDLGKALTPARELPAHRQHEHTGLAPLRALCERLRVPAEFAAQAAIGCREHLNVHRIAELKPVTVHDLIARCDGFRKPERIVRLGMVCEADKRGRLSHAEAPYPQRHHLAALHAAALAIKPRDLDLAGLSGEKIGEKIRQARVSAISLIKAGPGSTTTWQHDITRER
ncbi:multifunctional CCA addition/repair protein [Xanthomonadaceae bacterium JHOS43]|nr:multifunctional CCA addition/repair protein [Xanthomonadaceae bacterium JHOS43]